MTHDSRQIGNWFLDRAAKDGRTLSLMAVLKLVYFAHGWTLALLGRPLVRDRIEAWQYGPVIPALYEAYRQQGVYNLKPVQVESGRIAADELSILDQVYQRYAGLSPFALSAQTHERGGPWDIAIRTGGSFATIPDDLTRLHFESKRTRAKSSA